MSKPWENERCDEFFGYYSIYPVPVAAALWCGIPPEEIERYLNESEQTSRGIYKHPKVNCLEVKCRAIHDAINSKILPVSRENGRVATDHVAPERRHVSRQNLKEWIEKQFPAQKPAFLFDEIERSTHTAINAESYRALQADRDALRVENEKLSTVITKVKSERDVLDGENRSLKANLGQPRHESFNPEDLKEKERQSLYKLVAAMAYAGYQYDPTSSKSLIPKELSDDVIKYLGETIDTDTVRKWLKEATDTYPNQTSNKTE